MNRKDADTARRLGPSPWRDDWMPATKETLMDVPEPTNQAMAAASRAFDAGAEVYISGGTTRIEFTEDVFETWFTAEAERITDASAHTTAPPVSASLASELVPLASRLLHLRPDWEDPAADEELRRIAVRLGELANGAAPRTSQAATATNGVGDDAGAAHDPHKPAAGHTEPRMRPEDVPGDLVVAAHNAWDKKPVQYWGVEGGVDGLDDVLRHILAAVIPAVRAQAIADHYTELGAQATAAQAANRARHQRIARGAQ